MNYCTNLVWRECINNVLQKKDLLFYVHKNRIAAFVLQGLGVILAFDHTATLFSPPCLTSSSLHDISTVCFPLKALGVIVWTFLTIFSGHVLSWRPQPNAVAKATSKSSTSWGRNATNKHNDNGAKKIVELPKCHFFCKQECLWEIRSSWLDEGRSWTNLQQSSTWTLSLSIPWISVRFVTEIFVKIPNESNQRNSWQCKCSETFIERKKLI